MGILLSDIEKIIKEAEKYLEYKDNWDGEGSKEYKKETLDRVESFLKLFVNLGNILYTPKILPGPNGSFDLLWERNKLQCLLNIPEDYRSIITFFGKMNGSKI